jgi:hypothetical protein
MSPVLANRNGFAVWSQTAKGGPMTSPCICFIAMLVLIWSGRRPTPPGGVSDSQG